MGRELPTRHVESGIARHKPLNPSLLVDPGLTGGGATGSWHDADAVDELCQGGRDWEVGYSGRKEMMRWELAGVRPRRRCMLLFPACHHVGEYER